jgi:hypothetical protein
MPHADCISGVSEGTVEAWLIKHSFAAARTPKQQALATRVGEVVVEFFYPAPYSEESSSPSNQCCSWAIYNAYSRANARNSR